MDPFLDAQGIGERERGERREAKSEKREARSERREARTEKRDLTSSFPGLQGASG